MPSVSVDLDRLDQQIESSRQAIRTDAYSLSIGEIINLYSDGELVIHPEYQRLYRWSIEQKSRLVDSILLGIPIPSVFVSQQRGGEWEIVDGLQRISTILELAGVLKDPDGRLLPPLMLKGTKKLPALEGKRWTNEDSDNSEALTTTQKLLIKRAKIDFKIVLRESDPSSKYELFQRLNGGGTVLTPQEARDCLLVMVNREFAEWTRGLAENPAFRACIGLSDSQIERREHRDLLMRFLAFRHLDLAEVNAVGDIHQFLDDRMSSLAVSQDFERSVETEAFDRTFGLIQEAFTEDAFRRYDPAQARFTGRFLISAYEVIAIGCGFHQPTKRLRGTDVSRVAKQIWNDTTFQRNSGAGVRASTRLRTTIGLGRRLFSPGKK